MLWLLLIGLRLIGAEPAAPAAQTIRVAAVQAQARTVDFRLKPAEALARVDENLTALELIVDRAGQAKCHAVALPEDTLGLLNWLGMNEASRAEFLPMAVQRMLDRLGRRAAKHQLYLVVCSDHLETDGSIYNTSFLLGPDGKELGRYHKTCLTWSESGSRKRGTQFPVFNTPTLGTVGMLICYDLVMPETARCLALQGADIIFFPTMGGAAIGDEDIGVQALRVRAVENFVWLVVAHRGRGALIISPQGKIVAQAEGPDGMAIADIDPRGGREGGDSGNWQLDMRARLFRERNPAAFSQLTDPHAPVLDKVPIGLTREEAGNIMARMLTVGEEEFRQARTLERAGKVPEAVAAFEILRTQYRDSWIDRAAASQLKQLRGEPTPPRASREESLATKSSAERMAAAQRTLQPFFEPPAEFSGDLGNYRSPLLFNDGTPVKRPAEWPWRRAELLRQWHQLMGEWPNVIDQPKMEILSESRRENFIQQRVRIEIAPGQTGEGWLLLPDAPGPHPAALVVYYEPETSVGLNSEQSHRDFGRQLAQRGFVTLSIGTPGGNAWKPDLGQAPCQPLSFHAYVAANCWQVLARLPQVDRDRIGVVGHSYGGKWALFAAALWEKFACVAVSDPGIVFDEARSNVNYWEPWYLGLDPAHTRKPGLPTAENPRTGAYAKMLATGRDLHELHALIAPRPFLVSGGAEDLLSRWPALNHTRAVNQYLGYTNRVALTHREKHDPNEISNAQLCAFFEYFLTPER